MRYRRKGIAERGGCMYNSPEAAESLSCLGIKGRQVWLGKMNERKGTAEVEGAGASLHRTLRATGWRVDFTLRAAGSHGGL